jgi:CRP/FNR family transcriptional regulator, anaerobic regulatory protein
LARGFYITKDTRKEITDFLWNEHSLITVPDSFFRQRPSHLFIEVMPETRLMSISYQGLMACIEKYPLVEVFSRNVVLQYSIYKAKRNHDLAFLTPWELYVRLLYKHPNIEQQVSKGIIASYLNITPQSLSRMLKRRRHP